MSSLRAAALTISALRHAIGNRRRSKGLYFHSYRGIEYATFEYKAVPRQHGFIQSMNRSDPMNDNAHMESFFHPLKVEGRYKKTFDCDDTLQEASLNYIQFYNQQRLQSLLRSLPPAAFKRMQTLPN